MADTNIYILADDSEKSWKIEFVWGAEEQKKNIIQGDSAKAVIKEAFDY